MLYNQCCSLIDMHAQEFEKNISDAEGIYMAHDRRHSDD